jgi:hypothetical protein
MQLSNFELHKLLMETINLLSPLPNGGEIDKIKRKLVFTGFSYDDFEIENGEKPGREEFETVFANKRAFLILRKRRDEKLNESDSYVAPDYPHASEEVRQAWLDYRQALRDLPTATEDPENPVWPSIPTA